MIHGHKTKQLSRERKPRQALIKTLAVSLIGRGRIETTTVKAKVLRPWVEKLVTKAKAGNVSAFRFIQAKIGATSAKILIEKIAPKYKDRRGGYLRLLKLGRRLSDGADQTIIEFV